MQILDVKTVLRTKSQLVHNATVASRTFLMRHSQATPSDELYTEAGRVMAEVSGIEISSLDAKRLLSLYPFARIMLAESGTTTDTDVHDELLFVVAHFFLSSNWPTQADGIDHNEFIALLHSQAEQLGFSVSHIGEVATSE